MELFLSGEFISQVGAVPMDEMTELFLKLMV
jgi:hypothetical protein